MIETLNLIVFIPLREADPRPKKKQSKKIT